MARVVFPACRAPSNATAGNTDRSSRREASSIRGIIPAIIGSYSQICKDYYSGQTREGMNRILDRINMITSDEQDIGQDKHD
jgi:hypothetical protein